MVNGLGQMSATLWDERAKSYNLQNFPVFKEPLKFFVSVLNTIKIILVICIYLIIDLK